MVGVFVSVRKMIFSHAGLSSNEDGVSIICWSKNHEVVKTLLYPLLHIGRELKTLSEMKHLP